MPLTDSIRISKHSIQTLKIWIRLSRRSHLPDSIRVSRHPIQSLKIRYAPQGIRYASYIFDTRSPKTFHTNYTDSRRISGDSITHTTRVRVKCILLHVNLVNRATLGCLSVKPLVRTISKLPSTTATWVDSTSPCDDTRYVQCGGPFCIALEFTPFCSSF